jgi:iron complex transport system ATP-binding protein
MIEIKNLSFSYGKDEFIKNLDVILPDSSLIAIVGENGSGKTTLLSLILGEIFAKSGEIKIDGLNLKQTKRSELSKRLSIFPQSREIPDMTGKELVTMGRYPYIKNKLITPSSELKIVRSALIKAGAQAFGERRLASLSYGERQRVYLAMQIAQDAQNMLLDEPTNYLDISAKFQTMELLTSLKNEGKCIVCVLHDISLAMTYADLVAVMKGGSLIAFDSPEKIHREKKLEEAFGVKFRKTVCEGRAIYTAIPK